MTFKSHIKVEDEKWLKFDLTAETKLISEAQIKQGENCSYRKVHYTRQDNFQKSFFSSKDQHFKDPQFPPTNEIIKNIQIKEKVILKRLYKLYPNQSFPPFFPKETPPLPKFNQNVHLPSYISEVNLFDPIHYKSLFITQNFNQNGLYHILINNNGRYETDVVDDYIPVYQETDEPIWGMDLQYPWQIILLKFWAKKLRGYDKVLLASPFEFIEFFTNSNWKYFNISRQGKPFLDKYSTRIGSNNGKFILKTKDSELVASSGLVRNCAGYELLNIETIGKPNEEKKYLLTIRSILKNKWTGQMSVIDQKLNSSYKPNFYQIRLERDFFIYDQDFINLFSSAYVAAKREKQKYYSSYYVLEVPAKTKRAIYLEFQMPQEGFFDFAIKQWDTNKKNNDMKSSNINKYLKNKYMLIEDTSTSGRKQNQFALPKFYVYEVEYAKGYNKGQAHFEIMNKGKYLLKIKPQENDKPATFTINYCSNSFLKLKVIQLTKEQSGSLMRESMISLIDKSPRISINIKQKQQEISFGNNFQEIGYGFVAVRSKKTNPNNIFIQINPIKLRQQGFSLKSPFKNINQIFGILVRPGQSSSIILKKISKNNQQYDWPPQSLGIYTQPLKPLQPPQPLQSLPPPSQPPSQPIK